MESRTQSLLADDVSSAGVLWHYTSFSGLLGILTSKNIRLSSIGYLNDGLEFDYGAEVVKNAIFEEFQKKPENAKKQVDMIIAKFNGYSRKRVVYVASFSTDGDSLTMWRAYAGVGPSYAIGFDREKLLAASQGGQLKRVLYEQKDVQIDVTNRIGQFFKGYEDSEQANPP